MTYTHVLLTTIGDPLYRETVRVEGRRLVAVRGGVKMTTEEIRSSLTLDPSLRSSLRAILEEDGTTHWFTPRKIFELLGFCSDCDLPNTPCPCCGGPHRCSQTSPT